MDRFRDLALIISMVINVFSMVAIALGAVIATIQIDATRGDISDLQARMADLKSPAAELAARIETTNADLAQLGSKVSVVTSRTDDLSDRVQNQREWLRSLEQRSRR